MASSSASKTVLHTYFRSSASYRLRMALNYKGIAYEQKFVNLVKGEQKSDEYKKLNPSGIHYIISEYSVIIFYAGIIIILLQPGAKIRLAKKKVRGTVATRKLLQY